MISIGKRLALAFFCVVVLMFAQGVITHRSTTSLNRLHRQVAQEEGRNHRLQEELSQIRLTVYKLIGTLNPTEMDSGKLYFDFHMGPLAEKLKAFGLDPGLVDKTVQTYKRVISEHYNFMLNSARDLMNGDSKSLHELLLFQLKSRIEERTETNRITLNRAHNEALILNVLLVLAALIMASAWAVVLARGLTDRKKAERDLQESEKRYRIIVEAAAEGIAICVGQRFVFVNSRMTELTGYTQEELTSRPYLELLHPEDRDLVTEIRATRMAGMTVPSIYDYRLVTKKGEVRWVHVSSTMFLWEGEKASFKFYTDITERKLAAQELAESEERYRLVIDNAMEGLLVTQDAKVKFYNPRIVEISGYSEEEFQKRCNTFINFVHPEDRQRLLGYHEERFSGGKAPDSYEFKLLCKNGEAIRVQNNVVIIQWEGRPAALHFTSDLTERIKAEEERQRLEEQLQHSQKMEAIGTLAGGIAHDFNNLLTAIIGYSELALEDAALGEDNSSQIQGILKAGNRAKDLVTQILAFSRKLEPTLKPVDLNQVVTQTVKMLGRMIPRMIEIEEYLAEDLWLVNADPSQLSQVLLNLATNATDAMPDGGSLVFETANVVLDEEYCRSHAETTPGDYTVLTISDTGHGIDSETLKHIFDPFFTKKEVGKGTGLGLATVYGVIKNHRGNINCYSEVGRGTVFKIYLPAQPTGLAAPEEEKNEEIPGGRETVLVVDDEEAIRDIGRRLLEAKGYKVRVAGSGEEALEIYRRDGGAIDLVILDISMPGMGGRKCLKELKELDPEVKVLVASGYSLNGQLKDIKAEGAAGFVAKPFLSSDLLRWVRVILEG